MEHQNNGENKRGVLNEDLDAKLDLVLEAVEAVSTGLERVDGKVDDLKKEVDYKFEVVVAELHSIRIELEDKVGRTEFKEFRMALASLAK